jgi:catechol 2,3-dioxygenase-like lactoylglutathione lyase family enzyme
MSDASIVFDHVHLIGEDPEASANWYADMLGGKFIGIAEVGGAPSARVGFEGATVIIRGRRKNEEPGEKKGLQWGTDHFGFHISGDFDGYCNALKQKGVKFTMDPVDFTPTIRIAFIEAPDGVSIELLQRK